MDDAIDRGGFLVMPVNPFIMGRMLESLNELKPISTEAKNDRAIALVEELEHRSDRSVEKETLLDFLLTLIEKFESEHYPIPAGLRVRWCGIGWRLGIWGW